MDFNPNSSEVKKANREEFPWVIRKKNQERIIHDYLEKIINFSTMYAEAERNGYGSQLLQYIRAVANVQAQMIFEEPSGIGWNGMVIFQGDNTPQQKAQFFRDCRRQAQTGDIEVPIPTGVLQRLKNMSIMP